MKDLLDQTFKLTVDEEKKNVYLIFAAYYNNQLWNPDEIQYAVDVLRDFATTEEVYIEADLKVIENTSDDDRRKASYDFTKLFLGPGQLKVPPYESVYVNQDRLTMTESTMDVRRFYEMCGVEVEQKGRYPEDHFAFEMEFLAFLYHQVLHGKMDRGRIKQFIHRHLERWYEGHLLDVLKHAETDYCRAWAAIMLAVITKDVQDHKQ